MPSVDRRRHRRYQLQVAADLLAGDAPPRAGARLADLSRGGAFLVGPAQVGMGATVQIGFRYRDAACEASGYVVRTLPFGARASGFAVRFERMNEGLQEFLRALEHTPESEHAAVLEALAAVYIRVC